MNEYERRKEAVRRVIEGEAVSKVCAVVTKDVPPFTIVAGIPANIVRRRGSGHIGQSES